MIDRTKSKNEAAPYAELTGIVPQLTTPSRHHGNLVDIWFGVRWRERDAEWEACFAALADGRRPDGNTPSYFNLFSHSSSRGLVAARQVSADPSQWPKIEEEARALISSVNREVATRRAPPAAPEQVSRGWTERVRDAASHLASFRWVGDPKVERPAVTELPLHATRGSSAGR